MAIDVPDRCVGIPGETILPGSCVFASAAAMALLDVACANACGVMAPVRSAKSWSASCKDSRGALSDATKL